MVPEESVDNVLIGKNIIEILTTGMYHNPLVIYREYIQNSVDAINDAVARDVLESIEHGEVYVKIDKENRTIIIEDNGIGVCASKAWTTLTSIAASDKDRTKNLGFRGIGRLAGLAYCDELIIETSHFNESIKTILSWNGVKLKDILSDKDNKQLASEVIADVATLETADDEKPDHHFFRVKLVNVTNDKLLDDESVERYLNMVAPVKFNPRKFIFDSPINQDLVDRGVTVKCYKIFVGDHQLFKPYNTVIYQFDKKRKSIDEMKRFNFYEILSDKGEQLAICWYSITHSMQLIPVYNEAMGIRFRKGNIQVGDEYTFQRFFKDTRFHRYFLGEIHIIHDELFPNGQRDYFDECPLLVDLETGLKKFAKILQKLCRAASDINSAERKIDECVSKIEDFKKKSAGNEFLSPEHEETARKNLEDVKDQILKNEEKLKKMEDKFTNDFDEAVQQFVDNRINNRQKADCSSLEIDCGENDKETKPAKKYKSNKLSKLTRKEQKLVGDIYEVLRNVLTPDLVDVVIYKIEERFGLNNSSEA